MAYAAVCSLMQTLEQLLQPNPRLVCETKQQQVVESAYQSLCVLQAFLEKTTNELARDVETLKVLERKITDVMYKAEDRVDLNLRSIILEDNKARAWKALYEELQEVVKEVDSLMEEAATQQIQLKSKYDGRSKSTEATTSSIRNAIDEKNAVVLGMDDDFNMLRDRLTDQTYELNVVSVVGMGGIGKTTLARKIYDDSSIRYHFDTCSWVTISEEYDERKMLLDVVSSTSRNRNRTDSSIQELTNDQLAEIVYRDLKKRRYLIVIDDLWSTEAWDQIQIIFPNDHNKSRILLTTRLKYVADYASTASPPHDMSFLNLENSWNLFTSRLFEKECCPPELVNIGEHIVQKCQGLPLSIVVIAGLLAKIDLTYDNWKKVEENLKSCVGVVSEQCLAILSLSYNYLPQHLKACFIYIGGFPEDMEIDVSKLINLWIGEQFVKARSHTKLQVVAEEYLEDLVDRSLILVGRRRANGRIKTCKIHDLLRQLCIREADLEKAVHVIRKGASNFSKGIYDQRRVIAQLSLPWEHLVHLRPRGGIKITTCSFICMTKSNQMIYGPSPRLFVSQFKLLKVLDVCSMDHDFSRVIPRLVHLRYVAANIDRDIPSSVNNLWNLQTMILRGSKRKVPQKLPLEIWTMSQIRYLDIGSELGMPDCLEAESRFGEQPLFLNGLQTLALRYCSLMKEILRRCPNLNKLSIYKTLVTGPEWSGLFDCLVLLQELETLHVDGNISMITHSFISSRDIFLPNLKQVRLTRSNLPWEYMVVMAKLPNLEVLKIHFECGATNSTDWRLHEEVVFQKLKYLRIADSNFKRWEAASDNFPMLEQLVLIWCNKLKEIPQGIGEIATLQVIELDGCNLTTETSAKKIQEEQEGWGNYGLQVLIKP